MTQKNYDVIVLGVGSMGSATCYYLAKQGFKVLGIEQFTISHQLGSHGGQSRIIRQAYFEHPDYVPLLKRAYENWYVLEQESKVKLINRTGLLYLGKPNDPLISGTRNSAAEYDLRVDDLDAETMSKTYPQFDVPSDFDCLFEPNAGFVPPEKTIQLYGQLAVNYGATISTEEKVISWQEDGQSISVKTNKATYSCTKLVITAGPWTSKLVPELTNKLKVTRQIIGWLATPNNDSFNLGNMPCWTLADESYDGIFYGFPILPVNKFGHPAGLKIGHHHPGIASDPDAINRSPTEEDRNILIEMASKFIPEASQFFIDLKVCMYTNTDDANFIIDFLPGFDNVTVATGFSGHGFKFAPVMGEILADLATKGRTSQPIQFLNIKRLV